MSANSLSLTLTPPALALANHLWQSTLVAGVAGLLTLTLRRNHARARYALWLAASIKFLVPFSLLMVLGANLASLRHATPPRPATAESFVTIEQFSQPFTDDTYLYAAPRPATPAAISIPDRLAAIWNRSPILPLALVAAWLIGFAFVAARWTLRWRRISAAIQLTEPLHQGREFEILQRMQRLAGLHRSIELRSLPASMEPGIFGLFRPILLWPQAITTRLGDTHLEAVLAHEVCHVRRRDNLTAAIHMLVEAIFWFHPLVWWLEKRLVEEREHACDEEVLQLCGERRIYAESILKVCEFCVETPLACVSGVTGADLKRRIVQILAGRTILKLTLAKKLLLTATVLLVVAVPIVLGQANAAQRIMLAAIASAPKPFRLAAHAMMPIVDTPSTGLIAELQSPSSIIATLPQGQADAKPFKFDVVSIRPDEPDTSLRARRIGSQFTADGFVVTNQSLLMTLLRQYPTELQLGSDSTVGGPDWVRTQQWDIRAKVADADIAEWSKLSNDSSAPSKERRSAAVLAMFADRFKLKAHIETKEGTVYALVVAKGGPKLKPSPADMPPQMSVGFGNGRIKSGWMTTGAIARLLTLQLGHPVIDETGITGNYDVALNWTPDPGAAGASGFDAGPGSTPSDSSAPSLFTAIQDQLGLKLEAQKGPIAHLVIDSAEKPSIDGAEVPDASLVQEKSPPASETPLPSFDVVSVKPSSSKDIYLGLFTYPGGRIVCTLCTVHYLITEAFGIQAWQVSGGPGWAADARYDIEAKPPVSAQASNLNNPSTKTPPNQEQQQMLQSLLIDRFQLKIHWEPKQGPIYILTRGDKPLKLEPPKDKDAFSWAGGIGGGTVTRGTGVAGANISMPQLAKRLSGFLGRPVMDQTGLEGSFDFEYRTGHEEEDTDYVTGILTSMREIGLKLTSGKGPVETIVIDHVERPSEN
jgi:bla regulator protein blaR1